MANKGPYIANIAEIMATGYNSKTGLPFKFTQDPATLKDDIRKLLRIKDEQTAVRRFKWLNLPDSLSTDLIERVLYYRGQGAFFYMQADNSFYFLPYALDGNIDPYGRYLGITPLPFMGGPSDGKDKPWIVGLRKKPVYGVKYDALTMSDLTDSCVLLSDYTKQISQINIPRQSLNDPLLNVEAEMIPLMRTSCILSTGVTGMRVNSADEADAVSTASKSLEMAAMTGHGYVPIISNIEFQELTDTGNAKFADYMQAYDSLEELRLSTYGLGSGSLFEKKAHMLDAEMAQMGGSVDLVYQDSLTLRQEFCDIVNSIWGLGIACIPSDAAIGGDYEGDGFGFDTETSQGADTSLDDGGYDNDTTV